MMNMIIAVYAIMASTVFAAEVTSNSNHTVGVSYYDLAAFKELNAIAERCNEELGTNFTLRSTSFGDWELFTSANYTDEVVDEFTDCVDPETKFPLVFGLEVYGDDSDTTFSYEGIVDLEQGLTPMTRYEQVGSIFKRLARQFLQFHYNQGSVGSILWSGYQLMFFLGGTDVLGRCQARS